MRSSVVRAEACTSTVFLEGANGPASNVPRRLRRCPWATRALANETKYDLKSQYWANSNWIFHRSAVEAISKLKDGDGQYIWQASVVGGDPDMLLGFPMLLSEYAPSTFTTGLYVGILGDFNFYHIAESLGMSVQRLEELYENVDTSKLCTGCGYCGECSEGILIPDVLDAYTNLLIPSASASTAAAIKAKIAAGEEGYAPSACSACKQCEEKCPNSLPVSELMAAASENWPS